MESLFAPSDGKPAAKRDFFRKCSREAENFRQNLFRIALRWVENGIAKGHKGAGLTSSLNFIE